MVISTLKETVQSVAFFGRIVDPDRRLHSFYSERELLRHPETFVERKVAPWTPLTVDDWKTWP